MKFNEFAEALKERESSNNYKCVNRFGFMGAYQFGKPRLWDLGISIDGYIPKGFGTPEKEGKTILKLNDFLNNPELQDNIFRLHVKGILKILRRTYSNYIPKYTESGLVAGAHLKWFGNDKNPGLKHFLLYGTDSKDGLGTSIGEYVNMFAGYDLTDV